MVEQIGPHRQAPVGEINGIGRPIAIGIGIGLQINRVHSHRPDAIQKQPQIALNLGRIWVVDVVEVDMHHLGGPGGVIGVVAAPLQLSG